MLLQVLLHSLGLIVRIVLFLPLLELVARDALMCRLPLNKKNNG